MCLIGLSGSVTAGSNCERINFERIRLSLAVQSPSNIIHMCAVCSGQ